MGWSYNGQWKDGEKHGSGKLVYVDSSYYDGQWANDRKNGVGEQTYFDEQGEFFGSYSGGFKDDLRNGQGTFTYANGYVQSGVWKSDDFMG